MLAHANELDHEGEQGPAPETLAVFTVWSARGRGDLTISEGNVVFHSRDGREFSDSTGTVAVVRSGMVTRVTLHSGADSLAVSAPFWRTGAVRGALEDAGCVVTGA